MKRYLLIPLFAAAAFLPAAAQSVSEVPHLEDSLKAWRHHIHRNPELSYKEYATSRYVADCLRSFGGIEVSHPTETSVLGILRGGKPGPVVAFRADMDALPVQEQTDFPFASRVPGVSHACGHDMHTAMLLGTARVLASRRDDLPGTVYLIFQHAEEVAPGGAKEIIATGVLDSVDAFFGAHVTANYPVGSIGILPAGAATTAADGFMLTIEGKGAHGSMPQAGIDPIVTGSEIVMLLQTIVSRNVAPGEMTAVSVGKFQSGDAPNVIPDKAELAATIRTVTAETRKLVEQRVRTIVDAVCTANGAKYDLNYVLSYPAVQNSPELRPLVRQAAISAVGADMVFDAPRLTASEDFSYYGEVAPAFFFIVGVGDGPVNHNPGFHADDGALANGVRTEVEVLWDYLHAPRNE